jgi:hypothetical protein
MTVTVAPGQTVTVRGVPGPTTPAMPGASLSGAPATGWTVVRVPMQPVSALPRFQPPAGAAPSTTRGFSNREALERRYKELSEKAQRLTKEGKTEEAKRVEHEAHEVHEALERSGRLPYQAQVQILPGQLMPGQPINVRPDPAIEELRSQVQDMRRQVEELKALVKKAADKK